MPSQGSPSTLTLDPADRSTGPEMAAVIAALANGDRDRIGRAVAGLGPVLRAVYDQGEAAWHTGAAGDFLAATLHASPRYHLRLHAHAVGARDSDLHTHKGTVYSTLLSGGLTNTTGSPALTTQARSGLDVWQCGCRPDGTPTQHRTGITALVDPATVVDELLHPGQGFVVRPGDYHRLTISPDPATPTMTLCLFERLDADMPDAFVLTNRPTPVVADRDMTPADARYALGRLLDNGSLA